jgi:hypothetical protein
VRRWQRAEKNYEAIGKPERKLTTLPYRHTSFGGWMMKAQQEQKVVTGLRIIRPRRLAPILIVGFLVCQTITFDPSVYFQAELFQIEATTTAATSNASVAQSIYLVTNHSPSHDYYYSATIPTTLRPAQIASTSTETPEITTHDADTSTKIQGATSKAAASASANGANTDTNHASNMPCKVSASGNVTITKYSDHFAHFMQQFFRCWSFWRRHPDKTHVFLTTDRTGRHWTSAMQEEFSRGIMRLLPKLGIQSMDTSSIIPSTVVADAATVSDTTSVSVRSIGPLLHPKADHFQAPSIEDMTALRDQVLSALSSKKNDTVSSSGCHASSPRIPRIAVINRRNTRTLLNVHDIVEDLRSHFQLAQDSSTTTTIPEFYFEDASFEEQVTALSAMDILITPHGAQETGLVFLPKCGGVLELIPEQYYYPKFFGTLAASAGLDHSFLYLARNTSDHSFDISRRDVPLCPPVPRIREAVALLTERWQHCCNSMNEQ